MSAEGRYVSRAHVELKDRARRAELLQQNKRQIAADVLRGELAGDVIPTEDRRAIERLLTFLEAA